MFREQMKQLVALKLNEEEGRLKVFDLFADYLFTSYNSDASQLDKMAGTVTAIMSDYGHMIAQRASETCGQKALLLLYRDTCRKYKIAPFDQKQDPLDELKTFCLRRMDEDKAMPSL